MSKSQHLSSIAELGKLISSRQLSPIELTESFLARIEKEDGAYRAFSTVCGDIAREQAANAEREINAGRYRGPLHGIPFSLKDVYDTKGVLTTGNSRSYQHNVPRENATVVQRLLDAGAVLLGKATTWEFAYGQPDESDLFPPSLNPWSKRYGPEGSSSGSAVAVAVGLSPLSMGTDTGGSVRTPAAACGIVGFKPTKGRLSRKGVIPNSFSHDDCGPLTWTVEDTAIAMNVVAGFDPLCSSSSTEPVPDFTATLRRSLTGLRVGVIRDWFEQEAPADDEIIAAFNASIGAIRDLGAIVSDVRLPPLDAFDTSKKIVATAELFTTHSADLRSRPHLLGESLRYMIMAGSIITAEDYIQACRWRAELVHATSLIMRDFDILLTPTMAVSAPSSDPMARDTFFGRQVHYTSPFNVTGYPALSLCNGFTPDGMPSSLQIIGHPFDEATVLSLGHQYEIATPWRVRRPSDIL